MNVPAVFAMSFAILLLLGCVSQQQSVLPPIPSPPSPPTLVGGDRDAHGCIGSAGYEWCEALSECIRPWETNCTAAEVLVGGDRDSHGCIGSAGYTWCPEKSKCLRVWEENCTSADGRQCKTVSDCGAGAARCANGTCTQYDEHGCVPDGGYSWCPEKSKCLRGWEEECPSLMEAALEEQAKSYCISANTAFGSGNTVYTCGEYIRVASNMPGAGSTFYKLGNYDPVATCPVVAPDAMSEQCRLLLFGSNCVEKKVQCSSAPGAVTDLFDDSSFVGAQLRWTTPAWSNLDSMAVDYAIYRGDENLSVVSLIKTTGQTEYDDVFDGGKQTFAYFVRARNADGMESLPSNIIYVQQLSTFNQPSPGQID